MVIRKRILIVERTRLILVEKHLRLYVGAF